MSLAGVKSSVPLTQHRQLTQNSKANIMANKKNVKVRDLKPAKDAKGGGGVHALGGGPPKHASGGTGVHASGGGGTKHASGGHGPGAGL
jgi:hypothetical protein